MNICTIICSAFQARRIQKTYDYEDQSGTITGSIISIYGPGGILLVEYKTETNPSGSNIWQTNHILNGSSTIARRLRRKPATRPRNICIGTISAKWLIRQTIGTGMASIPRMEDPLVLEETINSPGTWRMLRAGCTIIWQDPIMRLCRDGRPRI